MIDRTCTYKMNIHTYDGIHEFSSKNKQEAKNIAAFLKRIKRRKRSCPFNIYLISAYIVIHASASLIDQLRKANKSLQITTIIIEN